MSDPHDASVGAIERNFVALGLGDVLSRAVLFVASIYLARTLGVELYGIVALAATLRLYAVLVGDVGISILGSREVAEDPERARALAPALLTGRFVVACGAAAVMTAVAIALLPAPEAAIFAGYALTALACGLDPTWILIGLEDARPAAASRIAGSLVVLVATLVVVQGASDVVRVPLAVLGGELFGVGLLHLAVRRRGFRIRPDLDPAVLPVFRRALPLLGHGLLALSITTADVLFVRVFRDGASLGNYAAAYALVTVLASAAAIYGQSLVAPLTRLRAEGGDGDLLRTAYARLFALSLPAALGGMLVAPQIIRAFFGERYGEAPLALAVLLVGVPMAALRGAAGAALVAGNGGRELFRITLAAAGTAVALALLLVPGFGIHGAALSAVGTEAVRTAASLRAARRLGFPAPEPRRFRMTALAAACMAAVLLPLGAAPLWASVPAGALVYAGVLRASGALRVGAGGALTLRV